MSEERKPPIIEYQGERLKLTTHMVWGYKNENREIPLSIIQVFHLPGLNLDEDISEMMLPEILEDEIDKSVIVGGILRALPETMVYRVIKLTGSDIDTEVVYKYPEQLTPIKFRAYKNGLTLVTMPFENGDFLAKIFYDKYGIFQRVHLGQDSGKCDLSEASEYGKEEFERFIRNHPEIIDPEELEIRLEEVFDQAYDKWMRLERGKNTMAEIRRIGGMLYMGFWGDGYEYMKSYPTDGLVVKVGEEYRYFGDSYVVTLDEGYVLKVVTTRENGRQKTLSFPIYLALVDKYMRDRDIFDWAMLPLTDFLGVEIKNND